MNTRVLMIASLAVAALAIAALLIVPRLAGGATVDDASLNLDDRPRKGPADAAVRIVVFEDFLCPHCATFDENTAPVLERTYVEDGNEVAIYFANFVVLGPESERIAQVGECVHRQNEDAFWPFKQAAMRVQNELNERRAIDLAVEYGGVERESLQQCVTNDEGLERVRADVGAAQSIGLRGTPAVLVNGAETTATLDAIARAVDAALAAR